MSEKLKILEQKYDTLKDKKGILNNTKLNLIKNQIFDIDEYNKRVRRMFNDYCHYEPIACTYFHKLVDFFDKDCVFNYHNDANDLLKIKNSSNNKIFKKLLKEQEDAISESIKEDYIFFYTQFNDYCRTPNTRNTDRYIFWSSQDRMCIIEDKLRLIGIKIDTDLLIKDFPPCLVKFI